MPVRLSELGRQAARTTKNFAEYVSNNRWRFLSWPVIGLRREVLRRHPDRIEDGTTILVANWQTRSFLSTTIDQVFRCSPVGTKVVIVDNASTDGSREYLRTLEDNPNIRIIRLPVNVGHGVALDLAAVTARTDYIVALDVDAFPISSSWLDQLKAPLQEGKKVSGAGGSRGQVAPCCLMVSLNRFLDERYSFASRIVPGNDPWLSPDRQWDVGRGISVKAGPPALHRFELTGHLDSEGKIGEIFGDIVYHNGYATVDHLSNGRGAANKLAALATWNRAVEQFCRTKNSPEDVSHQLN